MNPNSPTPQAARESASAAPSRGEMHLKVLLPSEVLIDEPVEKVIAEAENGSFCLLPRHVDFVAALAPGILIYSPERGGEQYVAVDHGVLVKCGQKVLVSTLSGIAGEDLEELKAIVEEKFLHLNEHEREARTALARLEAATLRGFHDAEARKHG